MYRSPPLPPGLGSLPHCLASRSRTPLHSFLVKSCRQFTPREDLARKILQPPQNAGIQALEQPTFVIKPSAILLEQDSLHTRENAEQVLELLTQQDMKRIILVTSPFHQHRTYLTFAKVMQPDHIEIINYYADTGEWYTITWFLSAEHRELMKSEKERIKKYRDKGDLL